MSGLKFHVLCKIKNTVWDPDESPLPAQLTFVKNHFDATVLVSNNEFTLKQALEYRIQNRRSMPKACILWTMEPYFSTHTSKKLNLYGVPMYIFNLWNQNALFNMDIRYTFIGVANCFGFVIDACETIMHSYK